MRSAERIPSDLRHHSNLNLVEASILELKKDELIELISHSNAIVSCLGHNLSFKGIFGHPRRLVRDATKNFCEAIGLEQSDVTRKFILMNSSGIRNRDIEEKVSSVQKFILWLLSLCIPPHADNDDAADYLSKQIGQNNNRLEWVAVRPDGLTNESNVTQYELHKSPVRSAIFDPGKTSRINVAHFMAELVTKPELWESWKGQMPVICNKNQ